MANKHGNGISIKNETWRARKCLQCKGYFVARNFAQRYCGTECNKFAKQESMRRWWASNGNAWRAKRKRLIVLVPLVLALPDICDL